MICLKMTLCAESKLTHRYSNLSASSVKVYSRNLLYCIVRSRLVTRLSICQTVFSTIRQVYVLLKLDRLQNYWHLQVPKGKEFGIYSFVLRANSVSRGRLFREN